MNYPARQRCACSRKGIGARKKKVSNVKKIIHKMNFDKLLHEQKQNSVYFQGASRCHT